MICGLSRSYRLFGAKFGLEVGAEAAGFPAWAETGCGEAAQISRDAESLGVFGVPSFIVDGELWWGREHLADIRAILASAPA
jgi:2-hydroxychromene-2-carboxylate isomerase